MPGQQRLELGDRLDVAPERGVGAGQLPAALPILRLAAHPLAQLGDAAVVVAALPVGDLQVGLGHLHLGIELERLGRTRRSPLRPDPSGSRGRRGCCARPRRTDRYGRRRSEERRGRAPRARGPASAQGRRMASKIARSDGMSGRSRKWPRRGSVALDPERGLDAEDEVAVVAEVEVGGGEHRRAQIHHQAGHRGHQHHPHEVAQRVEIGAREDVAGLLDARLLHRAELAGAAGRAAQAGCRRGCGPSPRGTARGCGRSGRPSCASAPRR